MAGEPGGDAQDAAGALRLYPNLLIFQTGAARDVGPSFSKMFSYFNTFLIFLKDIAIDIAILLSFSSKFLKFCEIRRTTHEISFFYEY